MFQYYFQEKGGEEKEPFDWEKFIKDPETIRQDKQQDDPEWQKKWKKDILDDDSKKDKKKKSN